MPRIRRHTRQRQGYGRAHYEELLCGHPKIGKGFRYDQLESDADHAEGRGATPQQATESCRLFEAVKAEARQLWEDAKDWLIDEWLGADHAGEDGPGMCTRPWAWWTFDATEPRRQTGNGPPNSTMADDYAYPSRGRLHFGVPRCCASRTDIDCEYEVQGEYLERLGLFLPGEAEYWAAHKDAWLAEVGAEGMDTELE